MHQFSSERYCSNSFNTDWLTNSKYDIYNPFSSSNPKPTYLQHGQLNAVHLNRDLIRNQTSEGNFIQLQREVNLLQKLERQNNHLLSAKNLHYSDLKARQTYSNLPPERQYKYYDPRDCFTKKSQLHNPFLESGEPEMIKLIKQKHLEQKLLHIRQSLKARQSIQSSYDSRRLFEELTTNPEVQKVMARQNLSEYQKLRRVENLIKRHNTNQESERKGLLNLEKNIHQNQSLPVLFSFGGEEFNQMQSNRLSSEGQWSQANLSNPGNQGGVNVRDSQMVAFSKRESGNGRSTPERQETGGPPPKDKRQQHGSLGSSVMIPKTIKVKGVIFEKIEIDN